MEDYVVRIIKDPKRYIKRLEFNQIQYLYRYFKNELLFLYSFRMYGYELDKKIQKDTIKIRRIIRIIKSEINKRQIM